MMYSAPSGPISEAELIRAPYKEDVLVIRGGYSGRFGVLCWTRDDGRLLREVCTILENVTGAEGVREAAAPCRWVLATAPRAAGGGQTSRHPFPCTCICISVRCASLWLGTGGSFQGNNDALIIALD